MSAVTTVEQTAGRFLPTPVKNAIRPGFNWVYYQLLDPGELRFEHTGTEYTIGYPAQSRRHFRDFIEAGQTAESVPLDRLDHDADVTLDVGGFVGAYSVLLGLLNPGADLHVAEPVGFNRQRIAAVLDRNGVEATLWDYVIAGETRTVDFYISPNRESQGHSIVEQPGFTPVRKAAISASDLLGQLGAETAFVKIDTEGAEGGIARDLVDAAGGRLSGIIELHPDKLDRPAEAVLDTLRERFDVELVAESSPDHPAADDHAFRYNRPVYYFEE